MSGKNRPYMPDLPKTVYDRVMQYAGKQMKDETNPRLTKREVIALADYLTEMGSRSAASIKLEEEEPENKFRNFYSCPRCGERWQDESECTNDDRCPQCNLSCSPVESEDL